MDFRLWAIDAKGGQASVRHGTKWYLVSIDRGWEPTEFEDEKDAHRWARSVPSVSIDRRYATMEEAVPDIRKMCLAELDLPDVSFDQVRHLIPSDVKSRVEASPGDAEAPSAWGQARWAPLRQLIDEMRDRGYVVLERTASVCVLGPPHPDAQNVVFPASVPQLPYELVEHVLRGRGIDVESLMAAVRLRVQKLEDPCQT